MVSFSFSPLRPVAEYLLVTLGGAALFLIFGVVYAYEAWMWDEVAESGGEVVAAMLRR